LAQAKAPKDGEESQDALILPEPRSGATPSGAANLEFLRRPSPFRRFATPGSAPLDDKSHAKLRLR
jgi:hypothetical protein